MILRMSLDRVEYLILIKTRQDNDSRIIRRSEDRRIRLIDGNKQPCLPLTEEFLFFFFREAKKRRIEKTGAQREDGKRKGERIA